MKKLCRRCRVEKDVDQFHRMANAKDGRYPYCMPCRSEISSERHQKTREADLDRMEKWRNANKHRSQQHSLSQRIRLGADGKAKNDARFLEVRLAITAEIKENNPCAECGVFYPHYMMEFDHVRGGKKFNIGNSHGHSLEELLDEIDKCEVVCANCHRMRTYLRRLAVKVGQ